MSIPIEKLRQWGEHRRHFDRTREQEQLGQALLDLIEDREEWMRRGLSAVERAEAAEARVEVLRAEIDAARQHIPDEEDAADRILADALAADDAMREVER